MKIGIWHNTGGGGGARRHLYQHVKGLLARGHEVVSCCPEFSAAGDHDIANLTHEERLPVKGTFEKGRFSHRRWNFNRALHDAMEQHCITAAKYLDQQNIDVLLATNCGLVCIPAIARHIRAPSVIYIHDPWRAYHAPLGQGWEYPEYLERLPVLSYWGIRERLFDFVGLRERRVYIGREMRNAAAFDLRLTNSYFCRENIESAYRLSSEVSYQGVDTAVFKPRECPRESFALGVGSFWVHKGIDFVIEAMSRCRQPRRLVWIGNSGSDDARRHYDGMARKMGVYIETHAGISDDALVDLYNRGSFLLCAARLEPFGLTPLEANACGMPVLAIREGGFRETIRDGYNGRLVDKNLDQFATAMDWMFDHREDCEQMGKHGRAVVDEQWTLEQSISRLEAWLATVLELNTH